MAATIIIPARYASTRLPGKPLIKISGISLLERVWRIASSVKEAGRVVIATEDSRIIDHAQSFGGKACFTSEDCRNGTERVFDAIDKANITDDILINLQGDALLTPPWVLSAMIEEMQNDPTIDLVTPALELLGDKLQQFQEQKKLTPATGTTVVFDKNRNALYFSKQIIPYIRKSGHASIYRHIGIYGYRKQSLKRYIDLEPTPLELTEGLEQLRALENGMTLRIVIADYRGRSHGSVDSTEDVEYVERIIRKEGELV